MSKVNPRRFSSLPSVLVVTLIPAFLTLSACGGGGGGSGTVDHSGGGSGTPTGGGEVFTADSGWYETTITPTGSDITVQAQSLVSATGRYLTVMGTLTGDQPWFDATFGNLEFNEGSVSGVAANIYEALNGSWEIASGIIEGTVTSTDRLELVATSSSSANSSNIVMTRLDALSDEGLTLEKLSAVYTATADGAAEPFFVMTIAPDGAVTGGMTDGCVFNGVAVIPDTVVNLFEIDFNVSNCPSTEGALPNGDYSGIGAYVTNPADTPDRMFFFSNNGTVGLSVNLPR